GDAGDRAAIEAVAEVVPGIDDVDQRDVAERRAQLERINATLMRKRAIGDERPPVVIDNLQWPRGELRLGRRPDDDGRMRGVSDEERLDRAQIVRDDLPRP